MSIRRDGHIASALAAASTALLTASAVCAQGTDPRIPDDSLTQVSEHVYVIEAFPNVGIVIGDAATLVVDTGLGPQNGAVVAGIARKLAKGPELYLTTTHFHPEHAAGEAGFPAGTILIRPQVQQRELEEDGDAILERFRQRPAFAPYLEDVSFRKPDILFEDTYRLDLGGVHAVLMWLGPAHTRGDEEILVEEDRTLLTGDLAMKDRPPANYAQGSSPDAWIGILDKLAALEPLHVVPDHGALGDASLIAEQRALLSARTQ